MDHTFFRQFLGSEPSKTEVTLSERRRLGLVGILHLRHVRLMLLKANSLKHVLIIDYVFWVSLRASFHSSQIFSTGFEEMKAMILAFLIHQFKQCFSVAVLVANLPFPPFRCKTYEFLHNNGSVWQVIPVKRFQ